MSEGKTLKEIALELLEEYRMASEAAIYECSGSVPKAFVNRSLTKLDYECGRFREQIERVAEPKDWMEKNKDRILQAGNEGREVEFRIGGRLFAIREKAQ